MVACAHAKLALKSVFLVCNSLDRSRRFYRNLGFQEVREGERYSILSAGAECELHLHETLTLEEQAQYGVGPGQGSPSLVLAYETSNLQELAESLPPENVLAGPQSTPWGATILMVRDPDGHRLEFRERTAP